MKRKLRGKNGSKEWSGWSLQWECNRGFMVNVMVLVLSWEAWSSLIKRIIK